MKEFRGTGVALVTPFTSHGNIDVEALQRVVDYQIDNGIDYLVVLGTTGESVTLTASEKQLVIDTVVATNNGRLPLVLGIGGNNTQKILEEFDSRDLTSFAAVLSVSPAYNRPTQEGIYRHFSAISRASSHPIILYNVPGRTASNMLPETVSRLARDHDNIIGVKEAAGDLVQAMRMIGETPDDFIVTSGDDMLALPMTLAGGAGVISVIAQGFPEDFSRMIQAGLESKATAAYDIQYKMMPVIDMIFEEGNPAGIKAVLQEKGICGSDVRLPLVGVSDDLRARIDAFVAAF